MTLICSEIHKFIFYTLSEINVYTQGEKVHRQTFSSPCQFGLNIILQINPCLLPVQTIEFDTQKHNASGTLDLFR